MGPQGTQQLGSSPRVGRCPLPPAPASRASEEAWSSWLGSLGIFSYRFSLTISMRARSKSNMIQAGGDWDSASLLARQPGVGGPVGGGYWQLFCLHPAKLLLLLVFCFWF